MITSKMNHPLAGLISPAQVIVLTILFSLNYLLCYLVIIHYYIAGYHIPTCTV